MDFKNTINDELNKYNETNFDHNEPQSNDESNDDEHFLNQRSKFSANCSQFIDLEAKDSDCYNNDID